MNEVVTLKGVRLPEAHKGPLKLTMSEIEHPEEVIRDFFYSYTLWDVRQELQSWFDCTMDNDKKVRGFVRLHDHIQRLVEASWLLSRSEKSQLPEEENIEADKDSQDDSEDDDRLAGSRRLIDEVEERPLDCLAEIFCAFSHHVFIDRLRTWKDMALGDERNAYEDASSRKKLIQFCREVPYVVEAMYLIRKKRLPDGNKELLNGLNPDLKNIIEQERKTILLDETQEKTPMLVINDFCSRFSIDYVRKELWDLLNAVIILPENNMEYQYGEEVLFTYEYLAALMELAYLFYKEAV